MSKRPGSSPTRVGSAIEDEIVALRKELTDLGVDAGAHTIHYHLTRRHRRGRRAVPSVTRRGPTRETRTHREDLWTRRDRVVRRQAGRCPQDLRLRLERTGRSELASAASGNVCSVGGVTPSRRLVAVGTDRCQSQDSRPGAGPRPSVQAINERGSARLARPATSLGRARSTSSCGQSAGVWPIARSTRWTSTSHQR